MAVTLSSDAKQLLNRPNFAHLATLMSDGSPNPLRCGLAARESTSASAPVRNSLKGKNTRRDPRVALSIVDFTNPYEEVQIRGRVIERRTDPDLKFMDPISHKYMGKPFPFRNPEGRVALIVEVEKERYTKLTFEHTPGK
jgi:Pyridoxamine 5'-phosphate oxidase